MRTFPETSKLLHSIRYSPSPDSLTKHNSSHFSFVFGGFSSVRRPFSVPNQVALLTGFDCCNQFTCAGSLCKKLVIELAEKEYPFFLQQYAKEHGFVTVAAGDLVDRKEDVEGYKWNGLSPEIFSQMDHSFMNNKAYENVVSHHSVNHRFYTSAPKRCILNSQASDVTLDFVKNVHLGYSERNVFSFQYLEDVHQPVMSYGFTVDVYLSRYIKQMMLGSPNSVIVVVSDHGTQWANSPLLESERRLPILSLILPTNLRKINFDDVWNNQFTVTTHFDLHKTILELISSKERPRTNNYYYRPWPILPKIAQDNLITEEIKPRSEEVLQMGDWHPCGEAFQEVTDLESFNKSELATGIIKEFEKYINEPHKELSGTQCLDMKVSSIESVASQKRNGRYQVQFLVQSVDSPFLYAVFSASFRK
eukprot:CAMPEP_0174257894 /NCGR_PEP_ID=MMETSP0439-20130205/6990_1 /TAXON_ID=0 /ORGANISM="Stereomyxa ramosa, Strain Chinc5" /LENGTH=419 /DNA_ID=CAMNT_0015341191 /DNA_START=735 /DNA_END=1991 /DNA_ORIENTATION=+